MKRIICLLIPVLLLTLSCKKTKTADQPPVSDMQTIRLLNAGKVTITNGAWGTVSTIEGNCMPTTDAKTSTCKSYTIKREVRIYAYTTINDASPKTSVNGSYDSFNTQLVATVITDDQGFFQAQLPDGTYTVVFIQDGKLYASTGDNYGGISPVEVQHNKANIDLVLQRAVY